MRKKIGLLAAVIIASPAAANDISSKQTINFGTSNRPVAEIEECLTIYSSTIHAKLEKKLIPFGVSLMMKDQSDGISSTEKFDIEQVGEFRRLTFFSDNKYSALSREFFKDVQYCLHN